MDPSRSSSLPGVLALAVILFCLGALIFLLWPIHALVLQVVALGAMAAGFRACPPLAHWLAAMPAAHRAVFLGLLVAVIIGHFTLSTRRFFPFVAWDIFCAVSEQQTVSCRELIGTTAAGKSVRLLVEQLFPSIVQFDLPAQDSPEQMAHLVTALSREYNRHHGQDPLRRVDLMLVGVPLFPPMGLSRTDPSCELLHRYEISSAPSS